LQEYELVAILSPNLDDTAFASAIERIKGFVAQRGGAVTHEGHWGARRLAYSITKGSQRFKDGNYHLLRFSLEPSKVKELDSSLKIAEDVIRFLLVKAEGPAPATTSAQSQA
jgi:small subunit ribosomal protein S6